MNYTDAPVCVVDDDESVRDAVGNLIRCAGFRAKTFTSAREFLDSPRVDASCLVLDVELPGLSGLDLQEELARADSQIPIIFLTGRGDIPMTVRAIKAGAFEFLTKPFNDEDLLQAIQKAIGHLPAARAQGDGSAQESSEGGTGLDAARNGHGIRDRVLPVLAHELLQPVNAILLCLEAARGECDDDPLDRTACDIAKREAQHMARIVHDVMDVCRDARGTLGLRLQRAEIATIVADSVATARPTVEGRRQRLTVVLPPEPVSLIADATRLQQVLTNLLTNAAKFTEPGGLIRLTVKKSPDALVIEVRDNGKGISPELLPHIFDAFKQDSDPATRERGLGLGLSLVKSLVELHGGTIAAYSEGQDMGAQFTVRLPLREPDYE
jgi:two-component system, sensor histidine kinase